MTSLELARKIAEALDSKLGKEIKILKLRDLTVITDYFVIATGESSTQVRALTDEVEFKLKQDSVLPVRIEGTDTSGWMLMDYGTVIVHVFSPDARKFYSLERLWADAEPVEFEEEER